MNQIQKNKNAYLELLFANRNKEYGSYELRTNYAKRVKNAMLSIVVILVLIVGSQMKSDADNNGGNKPKGPRQLDTLVVTVKDVDFEKPKVKIISRGHINKIKTSSPASVNTIPTAIVNDNEIEQPEKIETPIMTVGNGKPSDRMDGPTTIGPAVLPSGGNGGSMPGGGAVIVTKTNSINNAAGVDQAPAYPGGESALRNFLNAQLVYPSEALEKEVEGNVNINFVVYEDGSVHQVEADKKDEMGFAKEAIRVVGKMPNWKPAMLGGKPVKCYFSVPVTYTLGD